MVCYWSTALHSTTPYRRLSCLPTPNPNPNLPDSHPLELRIAIAIFEPFSLFYSILLRLLHFIAKSPFEHGLLIQA